ncbi:MAG: cupin domain-containing protein [Chitinivibrionales bacterium]|nr:cupin domain-containing protein [Chitinivibrionales bacterium]
MANKTKPIDESLISIPFSWGDLVAYQEGSVVSRSIINKPEGTVTVFAFDKGEGLSTHSAPYDALVEIVDGTGVIAIEGAKFELQTGRQIIMPANQPHAVDAPERFKMVLIMIKSK